MNDATDSSARKTMIGEQTVTGSVQDAGETRTYAVQVHGITAEEAVRVLGAPTATSAWSGLVFAPKRQVRRLGRLARSGSV